jgi:hypothetical protein
MCSSSLVSLAVIAIAVMMVVPFIVTVAVVGSVYVREIRTQRRARRVMAEWRAR